MNQSHHLKIKQISKKGALLLELLIVVSILAIILSVGAQAVFVSLQSTKVSGGKDTAALLAGEMIDATRAIAEERWQNIYTMTKGTQHYHPVISGNKWVLASGDETIEQNGETYTRYIVIDNVSRDLSTRLIESSYSSANDDPSTQKIIATVTWAGGGESFSVTDIFLRWKNKVCNQTNWGGGVGSGVKNCPDTTYESKDSNVNTSGGQLKLN